MEKSDNEKIGAAFLEIAKTGQSVWTRGLVDKPKYNVKDIKDLIEYSTRKKIQSL